MKIEDMLTTKGTPYWCGKQDALKGVKSDPHYMPSILALSNKKFTAERMMDIEIKEYEFGYNTNIIQ